MSSRDCRGAKIILIAVALLGLVHSFAFAQTGTITGKISKADGSPLGYANVILVGTTMGAMSLADGKFTITAVPPGTYTVRAMMMGYKAVEKPGVVVNIGSPSNADFKLETTVVAKTQEIVVTAERALVEVTESKTSAAVSEQQLQSMPVDDVLEAVGLKAGIVKTGDDMHVRGGRGGEVQVQIDGVPVSDPLGGGTVDVGMLGTSGSEIVSGGMDAEYGDAQSAVINIATKEGGRRFGGELRYFTDDFGRSDKTYTNFDRLSLGFGGPTWWKNLRYYASGEATWSDGENTTIEPRPEHKITELLKFRERQSAAYNMQGKLTYNMARMKLDGEAIYSSSRSDDYLNSWNVSGYVGKIWEFQSLAYAVAPEPGQPEIFEFSRIRVFNHGPWAEIKDEATRVRQLNIRPVIVQSLERQEDGTQQLVTYTNFRAADMRVGNTVVPVIWDEAVTATDGTILYYKPWALFEGFQRQFSQFQPFLQDPTGADSSFVPFNSATRTPETRTENLQLKVGFSHNITQKLLYSVKVSRLDLKTKASVLDENGDQKDPAEFDTAGLPTTLPNGSVLPGGITTTTWYTDDDVPYFVTAYDYPFYSDQHSLQWLMRGDVTSEQFKGHRIKTGVQLLYNDLNDDERTQPALIRENPVTGLPQQGLNVNIYRNFNAEGAVYMQDKWEYEGMVLNAGLRYEWFTVGNNDQILIQAADIDPTVESFKSNLSPRLGVAFPITDRDKFFFHYGRFTQWPSRQYLFKTQDPVGSLGTLGNPNLEPELTVSYQAGISHQFTDDIAANFVVFNKDIYGLISSTQFTDSSGVQGFRFINRTYASSRGVELSLEKRLTRRLGFEVYYTYSFADGVASDADFGRSAAGLTHLPTEELPLDWDQRHTFNVTLRLADRNKWGATAIYSYGSGLPWTPIDRFARRQDPTVENSRRLEPTHKLSLQGRKLFNVYGRELTLFFEGRNLLDDDVLLPGGTSPGVFPGLEAAGMDGGSYLTETGKYGGAFLQDNNDDGLDEFNPVYDPTIWETHRQWRLGLGFEF
ncbi:MAG TPA: TonB-dependent receptor [Candidatus Krumholzibacteria bacterium]|nr:TonB-dependent receptor [Candidatus Krumholzibacteria bacterium]